MRTFIALNLPDGERKRIHRETRALREVGLPVRWVEADNLHITLKFLGEVRPERIADVAAAIASVASGVPPLPLLLEGFGAFPTMYRPRVVWMGALATPELSRLQQDLEGAMAECGFDAETRSFHPHLTLGRAHPGHRAGAWRGLQDLLSGLDLVSRVTVSTVDLMRSDLSREGAHYTVLSAARLGGS